MCGAGGRLRCTLRRPLLARGLGALFGFALGSVAVGLGVGSLKARPAGAARPTAALLGIVVGGAVLLALTLFMTVGLNSRALVSALRRLF